jgi:putative ABC transport system permease protein
MMRWEALVVTVISPILGTAIAAGTLVVVSLALTHSPVPVVPPLGYGVIVSSCALLALAATQLTTRFGLRLRPAEAVMAGE